MSDDAIPERWREAARAKLDRHWQAGTIDAADHERARPPSATRRASPTSRPR